MRVQQSGRLGNFLFQWVFGIYLSKQSGKHTKIIFDRYHSDQTILDELQHQFRTPNVTLVYSHYYGPLFKVVDYFAGRCPRTIKLLCSLLRVYAEDEYRLSRNRGTYRGFFQNVRYIEAVHEEALLTIREKLLRVEETTSLKERFPVLSSSYQVIHLRLGDFKKSEFGVVKIGSQIQHLKKGMQVIVCTDGTVEEIEARLNISQMLVLTPAQIDTWETLAVISNAKTVIASNSTLSWWGGYLASSNGADVYLPSRWKKVGGEEQLLFFKGSKKYVVEFE